MTRTTTTSLADGREIIYFDDAGSPGRPAESLVDRRELPARPDPGQLRFDALSREWVAVAAHRQSRTHLPPADQCPICPTTPANRTEIPAPDYDVAVFENRFPSLGPATS
jgi:UDPglucose--hexose-1-phosphate uridylyltransferase